MKLFRKNNILFKLIITLCISFSCFGGIINTSVVQADAYDLAGEAAMQGGKLIEPIVSLMMTLGDGAMDLDGLSPFFKGGGESMVRHQMNVVDFRDGTHAIEQPVENRASSHRQQRLRRIFRERVKPRGVPRRKNDGFHTLSLSPIVISKPRSVFLSP